MRKISYLIVGLVVLGQSIAMAAGSGEGQKIYQRDCAMCHGVQGISVMASAPSFKRGQGLLKSDFALKEHIKKGKNACPSFIGILRDQQIFDVIAYMRSLYP